MGSNNTVQNAWTVYSLYIMWMMNL